MENKTIKRKAIPKKVRQQVYKMYDGHCAYCGCELEYKDMQVDHVESLYWYNGVNNISNYKPTCRVCNFYKSTFTLEEFRKELLKIRERLEKVFIYRLSKKYGLIEEVDKEIKFYFEEMGENK
ncbi:MAG: HNH endonuclease signature motif containing protein [Clostridium perfringens]|nr:HNH endonuclease signature motif containing protein [Clostridium perfringens]